jgi:predicted transcriptional regulator
MTERRALLQLATDIVSSYVGNNRTTLEQLPDLIRQVHRQLGRLETQGSGEAAMPEPAVPIRRSVKNDEIICLDCGQAQKTLKRHLWNAHGLTPEAYREKWRLPADYPLVAPEYAKRRSEMAKMIGLGRGPRGAAANR